MLQDPIRTEVVDGFQGVGKVLDLFRQHNADGKDAAPAYRLAWIPDRQHLVTYGISS
jgi:hypothetical protein